MRKGRFSITIGLLLIAAALLLTAYNIWDDDRAEKKAVSAMQQLVPLINDDPIPVEGRIVSPSTENEGRQVLPNEVEYPDYVLDPKVEMPIATVEEIDYIGIISIPSIDCELPVISEWNDHNLSMGPCRFSGSIYKDNMIICAHNYSTYFGSLKYLSYGDIVTFTDMDGNVFNYQVIEIETIVPSDVNRMQKGDWDLTLFTCTIGGATRVTVRCEKVE